MSGLYPDPSETLDGWRLVARRLFDSRDSLLRMLGRRAHNYTGYHPDWYDLAYLSSFSPWTVDVGAALPVIPSAFSHGVQSPTSTQTPVILCSASSCEDSYEETLKPDRGTSLFLTNYFCTSLRY